MCPLHLSREKSEITSIPVPLKIRAPVTRTKLTQMAYFSQHTGSYIVLDQQHVD